MTVAVMHLHARGVLAAGLVPLVLAALACGDARSGRGSRRESGPASTSTATTPEEASPAAPLPGVPVTLYFPSDSGDGLVGEPREILRTTSPGDRAKQILSDLLAGPSEEGAVSLVPEGTRLRQVYVLANGTAYADFSEELRSGIGGGSDAELLTVYSIVNSLALNVQEISRVGILIEGRPCESLNGHLDLTHPLRPNQKLLFDARPDAEPAKTGDEEHGKVVDGRTPGPRLRG